MTTATVSSEGEGFELMSLFSINIHHFGTGDFPVGSREIPARVDEAVSNGKTIFWVHQFKGIIWHRIVIQAFLDGHKRKIKQKTSVYPAQHVSGHP